jgi:cell division protein ZapA
MSISSPYRTTKPGVEVQILGQRLMLKPGDDPRHIERLVGYVKRKIDELSASGPISSVKLAVLVALNIADDYFRALDETRELKRQVAQQSRVLLHDLERHSRKRYYPADVDGGDGKDIG